MGWWPPPSGPSQRPPPRLRLLMPLLRRRRRSGATAKVRAGSPTDSSFPILQQSLRACMGRSYSGSTPGRPRSVPGFSQLFRTLRVWRPALPSAPRPPTRSEIGPRSPNHIGNGPSFHRSYTHGFPQAAERLHTALSTGRGTHRPRPAKGIRHRRNHWENRTIDCAEPLAEQGRPEAAPRGRKLTTRRGFSKPARVQVPAGP